MTQPKQLMNTQHPTCLAPGGDRRSTYTEAFLPSNFSSTSLFLLPPSLRTSTNSSHMSRTSVAASWVVVLCARLACASAEQALAVRSEMVLKTVWSLVGAAGESSL